jgi:hypothetical protein
MSDIDLLCLNVTSGFKILGANAFDLACTSVNFLPFNWTS